MANLIFGDHRPLADEQVAFIVGNVWADLQDVEHSKPSPADAFARVWIARRLQLVLDAHAEIVAGRLVLGVDRSADQPAPTADFVVGYGEAGSGFHCGR